MNDNLPTMTRDEWAECMGIEDDRDARERRADLMRDKETDKELGHGLALIGADGRTRKADRLGTIMKGGKRLSEAERKLIIRGISIIAGPTFKTQIAQKSYSDIMAILERDDEPEYCTCGHPHGMHNADIWACDDCGLPVKGE